MTYMWRPGTRPGQAIISARSIWPHRLRNPIIFAFSEEVVRVESFEKFRLEARLESLCEKGCRQVWRDIQILERGDDLKEIQDLSAAERRWLLTELKQIMAVYGGRCSVG